MSQVELRPMTTAEYEAWYPGSVSEYAEEHIKAGSMPADTAHELAAKQFAELLSAGLATPAQHLMVGEADGEPVGMLWLNIRTSPGGLVEAFVYGVEVYADHRGKGFGRGIMVGAEGLAREHGAKTIKLHVFGDNTVARALYDSLGYAATNIGMAKPLDVQTT